MKDLTSPTWFSLQEYQKVLDNLVIVCVDSLVVDDQNNILLGMRRKFPVKDWWIFGGRMRAGETYQEAAARGIKRELGIVPQKSPQLIGYYKLDWEMRAETPQSNGCHVVLAAMKYELTPKEVRLIRAGNEHSEIRWFTLQEALSRTEEELHPYLQRILRDAFKTSVPRYKS